MTEIILFPSGLAFRAEVIKYMEPIFTVRKSVTLRVIAGPESPNTPDATIRIENSTVVDVEYRAYGDWPQFIVVSREPEACVLEADTNSISDSSFYLEALQAMEASQSERLMGEIVTDTRAIHQYHAAWRDATYTPAGTSNDVANPLTMDSIGERLSPETYAKRIINRTARMSKRLREAGVLVKSVKNDIHGVWALFDFLTATDIDHSHADVITMIKDTFPKATSAYGSGNQLSRITTGSVANAVA